MQGDGPLFAATQFNCIAEPRPGKSFRVLWHPLFIDRFAAEDRCHLNGIAMEGGVPRYVTCVSTTNVAEGWREHRRDGGVVIDVATGETVATGLSMPHSPRLHDGRLWILQSGTGELGHLDVATGKFEPVCFFPGFARGLVLHGDFAIVGVSLPRDKTAVFQGLALQDRLAAERISARCMIAIVDLRTGDLRHFIDVGPPVSEIWDVAVIPGVKRPHLIGLQKDDIRFIVNPEAGAAPPWASSGAPTKAQPKLNRSTSPTQEKV
ncbi:MAG TPA: TIGR03032 family protein [Roseovarius sp.]|nr:TIGR03032 family protein [Roseovarius sp.]